MGILKVGGIDADQPGITVIAVTPKAAQVGDIGVLRVNGQGKIDVAFTIVGDRVWGHAVGIHIARLDRDGLVVVARAGAGYPVGSGSSSRRSPW